MTATITTTDQLDELPVGTVIHYTNADGEHFYAAKYRNQFSPVALATFWEEGDGAIIYRRDRERWVGADVMVRKVDYLAMARHVDDCRVQLAEVRVQLAAALRAETEAIDALAAFIADSDKAVAA